MWNGYLQNGDRPFRPSLSFVYGQPSSYSWWDATGACRTVPQGEGCEQGDALAPALFALGQHKALCRPAAELHQNDALLGQCNEGRRDSLWHRLQLRQNKGVRAGTAPAAASWGKRCGEGTSHRLSEAWLSSAPQLIGHPDFVQAWAAESMQEERKLLQQLPELPDLQCSWLLFSMCASPRAKHALRTLPPSESRGYAAAHNEAIRKTLQACLGGAPLTMRPMPGRSPHCRRCWAGSACNQHNAPPRQLTGRRGQTRCP